MTALIFVMSLWTRKSNQKLQLLVSWLASSFCSLWPFGNGCFYACSSTVLNSSASTYVASWTN